VTGCIPRWVYLPTDGLGLVLNFYCIFACFSELGQLVCSKLSHVFLYALGNFCLVVGTSTIDSSLK